MSRGRHCPTPLDTRILDVLDTRTPLTQAQVRAAAEMDTSTTKWVLDGLIEQGLVTRVARMNGKQGRPAYLYTLAMRKREAA